MSAIVLLAIIGLTVWMMMTHPVVGWIGIAAIIFMAVKMAGPRKCGLCGNTIKKTSYTLSVDGKKTVVCANCGRRIEGRKSKEAVDALFK